ncbi:MAG: hypothetical protein P0120_16720 [Nitrospira sp.]|nr:hypothetical protein [Nitrospira sp.]
MEKTTIEPTSSSSSRLSATKITELTADGIAATRITTAPSVLTKPSNPYCRQVQPQPPTHRTATPNVASCVVRRTAQKLIDSPSTSPTISTRLKRR